MHWERAAQPCCHSDRSDQTLTAARRVTVSHVVESRAMLLWVGMKAAVLIAVAMHRTKLIQPWPCFLLPALPFLWLRRPYRAFTRFLTMTCDTLFAATTKIDSDPKVWSHSPRCTECDHTACDDVRRATQRQIVSQNRALRDVRTKEKCQCADRATCATRP